MFDRVLAWATFRIKIAGPLVGLIFLMSASSSREASVKLWVLPMLLLGAVLGHSLYARKGQWAPDGWPMAFLVFWTLAPIGYAIYTDRWAGFIGTGVTSDLQRAIPVYYVFWASYLIGGVARRPEVAFRPVSSDAGLSTWLNVEVQKVISVLAVAVLAAHWVSSLGSSGGVAELDRSLLGGLATYSQQLLVVIAASLALTATRPVNPTVAAFFGGFLMVAVAGDRSTLVAMAGAFLCARSMRLAGTGRLAERVSARQRLVVLLAVITSGALLLALGQARFGGPVARDDVTLERAVAQASGSLVITARISTLVERDGHRPELLLADAAEALPPPLDRLLRRDSPTGTFAYRTAIGYNNPNHGLGMSLPGETYWIGGLLAVFAAGLALRLLLEWTYARSVVQVSGVASVLYSSMAAQAGYWLRSDWTTALSSVLVSLGATLLLASRRAPSERASFTYLERPNAGTRA